MVESIQVGHVVPDFDLETFDASSKGFGKFSLAEQRKNKRWTVLFFYPADFTFVCATEFSALADAHAKFKEMNCDIVTVSTDTKFTHLAWHEHEGELKNVRYTMAADPTAKAARMFGVYLEEAGVALRGTFVISPDGKLMNAEINALNLGRNVDELHRKVSANLYLEKVPAEACPAQWKAKGDQTLKPGPEMVGKVHQALGKK